MQRPTLNSSIINAVRSLFSLAVLVAAVFLLGLVSLQAQQPTISVNVKVVNVLATVRDKHGQIISTLSKDDFILQEDGHPQDIRYFSHESDLPLTLVDTSLSQRRVLDQERSASYSFLDKMLRLKDSAFVIHFDHIAELLQDLTSSREKLQSALGKLKTPDEPTFARDGGQGGPAGHGGGRRYPQESRPDGKKIMERICQQTGGRLFEVSKKQSIDKIYSELQEELRNQYNLGYTPVKNDEGSGYRKIALTTKKKDLSVQARDGYYADR